MLCEMGCGREKTRVKWCKYVCDICEPDPVFSFLPVPTVNYKYYFKNNGNVSANRIKMVKARKLCPDGNGEVVMRDRSGKITDRLAYNY